MAWTISLMPHSPPSSIPTVGFNMKRVQKGHVTLKWYASKLYGRSADYIDRSGM